MSDINAKSPKKVTSSKNATSFEKEVEKIKIVMGPFQAVLNDKEYVLKMDPEYAKSYTEQMMELSKPVGTYTKTFDKDGKIVKRTDINTGTEYIKGDDKSIKVKRIKNVKTDVEK